MGKTNVAWRGAIEFSGFPVNVALYSRVRKTRNQSFRNLAPSGQPVKNQTIDPADGSVVDEVQKGVEVSKGEYVAMTPEAIEQIGSGVKTEVAKPVQFCPVDSIAWDLAIDRFAVRPDDKVPGSSQSTNIVWNGLRSSGLAYVSQASLTGGHDAILAVYADARGLWAALLPFEAELYDVPVHEFEESDEQADMFASVAEHQYSDITGPFEHGSFDSEYRARREAAIDAVIAGRPVAAPADHPAPEVPNLMDVLKAASRPKPKPKPQPNAKTKKERETV